MEVFNNKLEMPKWVCALAIALGAIALAVQAAIDVYQNVSPAMDWPAWCAQAWQMTLPTGFALAFAAMSGGLLRAGRWKSAGLLGALVASYMTYTALNSMDFIANQTVARTQAQIGKATAAKDIAEIKNKMVLDDRKEKTDNLWRTYSVAKTSGDREKALAQIKEVTQEPLPLEQTDVEVVQVGIGGTANRLFGWRVEAIQEAKALAYPVLVMIGKALGITLGFAFWPAPSPERWRESPPTRLAISTSQETVRKLSYDEAKDDLLSMIAVGARVGSQKELSERWGVGEGTVSKWVPKLKRDGVPIRTEMNGNKRAIVSATHINGKAAHA